MKKFLVVFVLLFAVNAFSQTAAPAQPAPVAPAPAAPPKDAVETAKIPGESVSLITDDEITIDAVFFPAGDEQEIKKYAILLHELGKNKTAFAAFAKQLAAAGIGYLALDLRGHGRSAAKQHYSKFAKEGIDNEFNRMYKDVNAAVNFLKSKNVEPENIFIIGAGLGANVAASSIVFNNDIGGYALLTPTANLRNVLAIPGVKVSKVPIFIAVAPDVRKNFLEASLIRNTAFIAQGPGRITFLTAFDKEGAEMLNAYLAANLIQWLLTPALPPVKDDSELEITQVIQDLPLGEE